MGSMNTLLLVVFITTLAGSVTLAAPERQQKPPTFRPTSSPRSKAI